MMKKQILVIGLVLMLNGLLSGCIEHDCVSDGERRTKSGIVDNVEWYGGTTGIYFKDGSQLSLSGSPNAKYDLLEVVDLLASGVNYTFYYHRECVMSDGNEISWYEGNVIDEIKVN